MSMAGTDEQQSVINNIVKTQSEWKNRLDLNPVIRNPFSTPKIVGGTTAPRGAHPEFALVLFTDYTGNVVSYCGGSLISSYRVLTAAHCSNDFPYFRIFVIPNFYSFNDALVDSDIYALNLNGRITHPNYESGLYDFDVSILKLERSSSGAKAKIFSGDGTLETELATIIGVGTTSEGGTAPINLQYATVPVISNQLCRASYGNAITDRMLCAGYMAGGTDSCQGDSGGPLWVNFERQKVQAGIVSFGRGCARSNFYGVYARTSSLKEFIKDNAPDTEFLTDRKPNIIPIIYNLLFNDQKPVEPVCEYPIEIGETINGEFSLYCYDPLNSGHHISYSFAISNSMQISISAPQSTGNYSRISLFSGPTATGTALDNDTNYSDDAVLINQLNPGTYTIEVSSGWLNEKFELTLLENNCISSPISFGSNIQTGFSTQCRSIRDYRHPYARYYSFTLDQDQNVTITSNYSGSSNSTSYIRLIAGNDLSATPIANSFGYDGEQITLQRDLTAGTYTIEVTSEDVNATTVLNASSN